MLKLVFKLVFVGVLVILLVIVSIFLAVLSCLNFWAFNNFFGLGVVAVLAMMVWVSTFLVKLSMAGLGVGVVVVIVPGTVGLLG